MFFYTYNPNYNPTNKYQVQMIDKSSGFIVNMSSIFSKEEDLRWYLYLTANLMENFRFIVLYQTYVSIGVYNYQYYQGCYEYLPEYHNLNNNYNTPTQNQDSSENTATTSHSDKYEFPPKFELNDNTLPSYSTPTSMVNNESNFDASRVDTTTSGFNFHFDPPTNLNFQIQENGGTSQDEVVWEETQPEENGFMVYPENNVYFETDNNNLTQVIDPEVSQILQDIELKEDSAETGDGDGVSDISDLLNELPIATSTPPPVDDDYWNVVEEENYDDMTLQKYGRGYILKCDSDHPDYGIKYFPSEENCRAWWQPANEGWFVRRENKNYFLERGAQFVYRHSKRMKR